jgi:hypothetical protein
MAKAHGWECLVFVIDWAYALWHVLNIQGQVQGIAIGLLLILSILLPSMARSISGIGGKLNTRSAVLIPVFLLTFILFFIFFFWSRAPVIAGG